MKRPTRALTASGVAAATLVAGLGLTGGSAFANPSTPAQHAATADASTTAASPITTSVPDTIAGTTSGWSTFALGVNTRGKATVTAPTGTRIAEVKVAGSGAKVPFTISDDGRTAVNDQDNAFNSTWRRVLVRLTVDPTATAGTTLDDGSIIVTKNGATLAEGTLAVRVAAPAAIPVTASAAFDQDDLLAPATVSGTGTDGAEVVVRNGAGDEVGRSEVRDGAYSVPVAPEHATWGVNTFTATQTIAGGGTTTASTTLDYGAAPTPAITSPEDGAESKDRTITFTGTGTSGARVQLADDDGALSDVVTVDAQGTWSVETNRMLLPAKHRVRAVLTGRGGLTADADVTVDQKLLWGGILSPSTVQEARPELHGIATAGATVEFRDDQGNVYGATTVGEDHEFRLRFARDLKVGFTQLILMQHLNGASRFDLVYMTYQSAAADATDVAAEQSAATGIVATDPTGGSTVAETPRSITGSAPARSTVALVRGQELLGTGLTNDADCFSLHVFGELAAGRNDLQLVATTPGGETIRQDYTLTLSS